MVSTYFIVSFLTMVVFPGNTFAACFLIPLLSNFDNESTAEVFIVLMWQKKIPASLNITTVFNSVSGEIYLVLLLAAGTTIP